MDAFNDPSSSRKRKRDKSHRHHSNKSRRHGSRKRSSSSSNSNSSQKTSEASQERHHRKTNQTTKIRIPYNNVLPRPDIEEVKQADTTQKHWGQVIPFSKTRTVARPEANYHFQNIHQEGRHQEGSRSTNHQSTFDGSAHETNPSTQSYDLPNGVSTQHKDQFGNLFQQLATPNYRFESSASLLSSPHGTTSTNPPANRNTNHQDDNNTAPPKILPCKARGMAENHNMINAYFTIPNTIKHADELLCSHPACRSAGPRFLYCKFCEVPVAKRNFRQRHSHLEMYPDPRLALAAQEAMAQGNYVAERQQQQGHQVQHHDNNSNDYNDNSNGMQIPGVARIQPSSSPNSSTPSNLAATPLARQRREWERLLYERPHSEKGDEMSAWLMKVMATSSTVVKSSDLPAPSADDDLDN